MICQGYLKKRVKELKFFQKKVFPTRHFTINFTKAILSILDKNKSTELTVRAHAHEHKSAKNIPFRNITECFLPTESYEQHAKLVCSKKYQYCFFLNTVDRLFELYASTIEERLMWVTCFTYLIMSTKEV